MFINFTNHISLSWSQEQRKAASEYGCIKDIPFPNIDPNGDETYIAELAQQYARKISEHNPAAVLCQGEMTLAFLVASFLLYDRIPVLAACSRREVVETTDAEGNTVKKAVFRFVRFRRYSLCAKISKILIEGSDVLLTA